MDEPVELGFVSPPRDDDRPALPAGRVQALLQPGQRGDHDPGVQLREVGGDGPAVGCDQVAVLVRYPFDETFASLNRPGFGGGSLGWGFGAGSGLSRAG